MEFINNGGLDMLHFRLWIFVISLVSLFFSFNIQAQEATTTVVEKRLIISPTPKATCNSIAGHWEGNVWINTHDVCKYENRVEGIAWVNDYWSCTAATEDGNCTNWVLVPGHWVKTLE